MAGIPASSVDPARPARTAATRRPSRLASRHRALIASVCAALLATVVPTSLAGAALLKSSTTTTTTTTPKSTTTTTKPLSPANRWLKKALQAEIAVGSVHIDGSIKQGKSVITLHLVVNGNGDGNGRFVQQGNTVNILRVGPSIYFKAPIAFWAKTATPTQAQTYGGRWIELSALDSRFQSFDQFLDAADVVAAVFQGHPNPLILSKPTSYAGHRVVILKDVVRKNGKTSTGLMYIGATGKPYVYRIVNNTPGNRADLVFSHYSKALPITVPPNAINLT